MMATFPLFATVEFGAGNLLALDTVDKVIVVI